MAQWMEEQEGRGWAGRGVDGGAMGGRGSGRGRRGGEVRPMGAASRCRLTCAIGDVGVGSLVGLWHASLSDCAVGRTGPGTGLLRVAALVGVFEL